MNIISKRIEDKPLARALVRVTLYHLLPIQIEEAQAQRDKESLNFSGAVE